jgi:hypothetical protein
VKRIVFVFILGVFSSVMCWTQAKDGEFTDMSPYTYQAYSGWFNIQILSYHKTVNKNLRIEIVVRFATGFVNDTAFFVDYIDPSVWGQFFLTALRIRKQNLDFRYREVLLKCKSGFYIIGHRFS